jgi:transcriptional regulator GlxA family with amidase domain
MDIFTVLRPPHIIRGHAAKRIGELNEALAHLHKGAEPSMNGILQEKSIAATLLSVIAECSEVRTETLPLLRTSDRIAPVLEYIRSNLKQDLRREALAKAANLSPSRFDTLFKSLLGMAPMAYVHGLRLQEAQRLLLNSDLSVKAIADAVGHEDPFHFSRSFKRHYGTSPQLFRQQAKERIL